MIDRQIIPAEQYARLSVQTDHRGQVINATVIDESLLYKWIDIGVLAPECMEYSRTLENWHRQCYRFLGAKTSSFGNTLGDNGNESEPYSDVRRLMDKRELRDIEQFITAHRTDWPAYWSIRYDIQRAYKNLIKVIDSLR